MLLYLCKSKPITPREHKEGCRKVFNYGKWGARIT